MAADTPVLTLRVEGGAYEVPSPPAAVGLAIQASWVVAKARRAGKEPPQYAVARCARYDDGTRDLDEDALGPAFGRMVEDGVSITTLRRAALAAYIWIATGSERDALTLWDGVPSRGEEGGGDPKGKGSTRTGGAGSTRRRASTSGTTSRRKK